jgi:hypothetical protein
MPSQAGLSVAMVTAVCLVPQSAGLAHDWPHEYWLKGLKRPDVNQPCCGEADIVKTKFKVENTGGAISRGSMVRLAKRALDADPGSQNPPAVCSDRRSLSVRD